MNTHTFGWKRDLPDIRDYKFVPQATVALPQSVDLRSNMPPIYDQGQLGSCTANAVAAHLDFERSKQGEAFITPSRLFIYYNERVIENTVDSDSGATIRDSIKSVVTYGAPHETTVPYVISKFAHKPSKTAYTQAIKYEALQYQSVAPSVTDMKTCLASGNPFVVGFTVYSSFESHAVASTGVMPMPSKSESVLGGHAVTVVGYKLIDSKPYWIARNSWGTGWGDKGYFYMPESYLTNNQLSGDFWTLTSVK